MNDSLILLDELISILEGHRNYIVNTVGNELVDNCSAITDEVDVKLQKILQALGNTSGTAGGGTLDTILSKVNEINTAVGKSVFKSWHRYVFSNAANTSMGTITLTESVDPTRCIVLSERLRNTTDQTLLYDFVLTASKITVSHQTLSGTDQLRLGFTVVELY